MMRYLRVLVLGLALSGCTGGAMALPVLDLMGMGAVYGAGAAILLPKLFPPAVPASPAPSLAAPAGHQTIFVPNGAKVTITP